MKSAGIIKEIKVRKLFGTYDYDIKLGDDIDEKNLLIFYGDNGCGKTTILKLTFYLLASDERKGYKTAAASISFEEFVIKFEDGSKVSAVRTDHSLIGSYKMSIERKKEIDEFNFIVDEDMAVKAVPEGFPSYAGGFLTKLAGLNLGLYMLSDDRQVNLSNLGDIFIPTVEHGTSERHYIGYDEGILFNQRKHSDTQQFINDLLKQSIRRLELWVVNRAMLARSEGESSVNALYDEILKGILSDQKKSDDLSFDTKSSIKKRIETLQNLSANLAQYGLMAEFSGKEILKALNQAKDAKLAMVAGVLEPYLESLERKLKATDDIYRKVDALITILNKRFFTKKHLTYNVHEGLGLNLDSGSRLDPKMLSSGEKHLLLVFCNSLVAIDKPSIMIIDEPEISLNVKWQRKLVSSLLEMVGNNPVQYILATHSIELLAQHKNNVFKLDNA